MDGDAREWAAIAAIAAAAAIVFALARLRAPTWLAIGAAIALLLATLPRRLRRKRERRARAARALREAAGGR